MGRTRVNVIEIPVEKLRPNPWNPNRQTDFIFGKELASIQTHGFLDPITVRESDVDPGFYDIIDGEHRWRAGVQLKYEALPCNNLGKVSDPIAKQLTIIANETRGKADPGLMSVLLNDLVNDVPFADLAASLPYTELDLKTLMSDNSSVWDSADAPAGDSSEENDDDDEWETLSFRVPKHIAEQFNEQVDRVKKIIMPAEDPADVSPVQALEVMALVLAQLEDPAFLGN